MKRLQVAGFLAIALCMAGSAWAHHNAAGIDREKTVTVEGTVKQFKWANPHSWVEIEVPDQKGGVEIWNAEMTSPSILVKAGWKKTTLTAGDKVKLVVNPMISGKPGGLFVSMTLPNGQVLTQRAPRPDQAAAAP
jgi:Family of unknown function (DUF6152)